MLLSHLDHIKLQILTKAKPDDFVKIYQTNKALTNFINENGDKFCIEANTELTVEMEAYNIMLCFKPFPENEQREGKTYPIDPMEIFNFPFHFFRLSAVSVINLVENNTPYGWKENIERLLENFQNTKLTCRKFSIDFPINLEKLFETVKTNNVCLNQGLSENEPRGLNILDEAEIMCLTGEQSIYIFNNNEFPKRKLILGIEENDFSDSLESFVEFIKRNLSSTSLPEIFFEVDRDNNGNSSIECASVLLDGYLDNCVDIVARNGLERSKIILIHSESSGIFVLLQYHDQADIQSSRNLIFSYKLIHTREELINFYSKHMKFINSCSPVEGTTSPEFNSVCERFPS